MHMMRHDTRNYLILQNLSPSTCLFPVAFRTEQHNKVSCRKQIASQHSRHKNWPVQGRGRGRPCETFLSSCLITMQNLVTISHTVCPHVGSKILGTLGFTP